MQSDLQKYTQIAAKVILNPKRMKSFMGFLNTKEGAVQAALTVVAAVDQLKKVPPEMQGQLAVNAYLLMVDVASNATGIKPSNKVLVEVIRQILTASGGATNVVQKNAAPATPDQPGPENQETEQEPDEDEMSEDQPGPEAQETEQEPDEDENVMTRVRRAA